MGVYKGICIETAAVRPFLIKHHHHHHHHHIDHKYPYWYHHYRCYSPSIISRDGNCHMVSSIIDIILVIITLIKVSYLIQWLVFTTNTIIIIIIILIIILIIINIITNHNNNNNNNNNSITFILRYFPATADNESLYFPVRSCLQQRLARSTHQYYIHGRLWGRSPHIWIAFRQVEFLDVLSLPYLPFTAMNIVISPLLMVKETDTSTGDAIK